MNRTVKGLLRNIPVLIGVGHCENVCLYHSLSHRIHGAAIDGNIYHQYTPNVSIYTIHGSYGYMYIFANARTVWRGIQGSPDSWKKFGCCFSTEPMGPSLGLADFSRLLGVLSRHQKGQEASLSLPGSCHHLTS